MHICGQWWKWNPKHFTFAPLLKGLLFSVLFSTCTLTISTVNWIDVPTVSINLTNRNNIYLIYLCSLISTICTQKMFLPISTFQIDISVKVVRTILFLEWNLTKMIWHYFVIRCFMIKSLILTKSFKVNINTNPKLLHHHSVNKWAQRNQY